MAIIDGSSGVPIGTATVVVATLTVAGAAGWEPPEPNMRTAPNATRASTTPRTSMSRLERFKGGSPGAVTGNLECMG